MSRRVASLVLPLAAALAIGGCRDEASAPPPAPWHLLGNVAAPLEANLVERSLTAIPSAEGDVGLVPVTGAAVLGIASDGAPYGDESGDGGAFDLELPRRTDRYTVVAHRTRASDGRAFAAAHVVTTTASITRLAEPLVLAPGGAVMGVVLRDGIPVAGAVVAAADLPMATASAPDGSYRLYGLPAGTWRLVAYHAGASAAVSVAVVGDAVTAAPPLELRDGASDAELLGVVVDGPTGTGIAGAWVRGPTAIVRTDSAGRFRLPLPAGEQRIVAWADGYLPGSWMATAARGELTLALERRRSFGTGAVTGSVVAAADEAPLGATLTWYGASTVTVTTDAAGGFRLGAQAGCGFLEARAPGFAPAGRALCLVAGRTLWLGRLALAAEACYSTGEERCGDDRDDDCDGWVDEGCDRTPPAPVAVSLVTVGQEPPGTPDWLAGQPGAVEAEARVRIYAETAEWQLLGVVTAAVDGSFPRFEIGDNRYDRLWLVPVDAAGNVGPAALVRNDIRGPTSSLLVAPPHPNRASEATFVFAADEPVASRSCRLDGGASFACPTTLVLVDLGWGLHTLEYRATDRWGNLEQLWRSYTWRNEPPRAWEHALDAGAWGSPVALAAGDAPSVVVATRAGTVYAWDPDTGTQRWRVDAGGSVQADPVVGDTDGSGRPSVWLVRSDGTVLALDPTGGQLALATGLLGGLAPTALLTAPQVDTAATLGLVVASDLAGNGRLLLWRPTAATVTTAVATTLLAAPGAGDLDGDGDLDAVVPGGDALYAYELSTLTPLWRTPWPTGAQGRSQAPPLLIDLDGDGSVEVFVPAGDGALHAFSGDGTLLWRITPFAGDPLRIAPAAADLDGDGAVEVVLLDQGGEVAAWHPTTTGATLLWRRDLGEALFGPPLVADLDPADGLEVGVLAFGGTLYALAGTDGGERWRHTGLGSGCYGGPLYVEGDRGARIVVASDDGAVVAVSVPTTTPTPAAWPRSAGPDGTARRALDQGEPDGGTLLVDLGRVAPGSRLRHVGVWRADDDDDRWRLRVVGGSLRVSVTPAPRGLVLAPLAGAPLTATSASELTATVAAGDYVLTVSAPTGAAWTSYRLLLEGY